MLKILLGIVLVGLALSMPPNGVEESSNEVPERNPRRKAETERKVFIYRPPPTSNALKSIKVYAINRQIILIQAATTPSLLGLTSTQ